MKTIKQHISAYDEYNDDWIRNLPNYDDDIITAQAFGIMKAKHHKIIKIRLKGGKGSGNFGHSGRVGMVGGSGDDNDLHNIVLTALESLPADKFIKVPWRTATTRERNQEDDALIKMTGKERFTWDDVPKQTKRISISSKFIASQEVISISHVKTFLNDTLKRGKLSVGNILLVKNGDAYRIVDGHHSLYTAMLLGVDVNAEVVEL